MSRSYASAEDFKRSLETRLAETGIREGRGLRRERQLVVYERFLVRACEDAARELVVKGGMAVELRTARARATRDIDLRALGSPDRFVLRLREVGSLELADFMTFRVESHARPDLEAAGMRYPGKRFRVQAQLAGKVYGDPFAVDVAFGEPMLGAAERIEGRSDLRFAGIEPASFAVYPRATHIAEKLHAYTLPRPTPNSRVKDLPDLAILAGVGPMDAVELRSALVQTFAHRATHSLPERLPLAPERWRAPYRELVGTNRLAWTDLEAVHRAASAFLDPVLAGSRAHWDPAMWTWGESSRPAPAQRYVVDFIHVRAGQGMVTLVDAAGTRVEQPLAGDVDVSVGDEVCVTSEGVLERLSGRSRGR